MHDTIAGAKLPSVLALAYIGDARHSLFVRRMLVERGLCKSGELNEQSLKYVTAEAQARMYHRIEHLLLDDEKDVFRRASNSSHLNRPKRASSADYRTATGFEAVIGMLDWLSDEERLDMLFKVAHSDEDLIQNEENEDV